MVSTDHVNLSDLMQYIVSNYEVKEFTIEAPKLEEIIKGIYIKE